MSKYVIQKNPFIVQRDDGKLIEEYFGKASKDVGDFSVAHMIAPPGWSEPFQIPMFDEITYIIKGKKQVEFDNEIIFLEKGESICVNKGARVRYSNPFNEEVEYVSFCVPAFKLDRVNRDKLLFR